MNKYNAYGIKESDVNTNSNLKIIEIDGKRFLVRPENEEDMMDNDSEDAKNNEEEDDEDDEDN